MHGNLKLSQRKATFLRLVLCFARHKGEKRFSETDHIVTPWASDYFKYIKGEKRCANHGSPHHPCAPAIRNRRYMEGHPHPLKGIQFGSKPIFGYSTCVDLLMA
jgi:hypothetical protein